MDVAAIRKVKKKQVKDEIDRIKQAEKKKRRLEKALATSAAIRLELEKKKQKKIEEQEKLDKEGAKIAEAVALHVLLGEDLDDSCNHNIIPSKDEGQSFVPFQELSNYSLWNDYWGSSNVMFSSDPFGGGPFGLSVGQLAAQAVSSLKIADDSQMDARMLDHILRG